MEVIDDRETGLGHLNNDELLYIHATVETMRRGGDHIGPMAVWACQSGEARPYDDAEFHGACKACVLAAAALAVNGCARPVVAYLPLEGAEALPIVLDHLTAFYDVMRERHGLPFLLHDEDRVYDWGWS